MPTAPPAEDTCVLTSTSDRICTITLNRPERLNAITPEMDGRLRTAFAQAMADAECRVVVLRGAGQGFCSGADRQAGAAGGGQANPQWDAEPGHLARFRFGYLLDAPKPVIAAINGPAIGVGLVIACCCDIRLASADARFAFPYTRLGLVAEYGIAWLLSELIGSGAARELLISGRMFEAPEAERLGLVSRVTPPERFDAQVREYAAELAERCSPRSVAVIKRQLRRASGQDFLLAAAEAGAELAAARSAPDYAEAIAARSERRACRFSPLEPS